MFQSDGHSSIHTRTVPDMQRVTDIRGKLTQPAIPRLIAKGRTTERGIPMPRVFSEVPSSYPPSRIHGGMSRTTYSYTGDQLEPEVIDLVRRKL